MPDINSAPTRSGNYILKVYLDGDTSNLVFTRRFLVTEDAVTIAAQVLQPFNPQIALTHQKIEFTINSRSLGMADPMSRSRLCCSKITAGTMPSPMFDQVFQAAPLSTTATIIVFLREAINGDLSTWAELSFPIRPDPTGGNRSKPSQYYLKPDADRSRHGYIFYNDIDGLYYTQTTESVNPLWQTDYAMTHFSFMPTEKAALPG